jgi:hypothetical protein
MVIIWCGLGRKMAMDISKAGLWAMRLAWKSFARYSGVVGVGEGKRKDGLSANMFSEEKAKVNECKCFFNSIQ